VRSVCFSPDSKLLVAGASSDPHVMFVHTGIGGG
jgi:hypothetical protein